MKIGGFELNLPTGVIGSIMSGLFWGVAIFILVGIFAYLIYSHYKNKSFYTNPVNLTMYYENGTKKTKMGLLGGKFVNGQGVWDFKVKIPKQFKKKDLGYIPDFSKADSDGTLHFITSGDGTIWQQVSERLDVDGEEQARDENGLPIFNDDGTPKMVSSFSLMLKPVRTDVKIATVNAMKSWTEMISKNKITVFGIGLGMFLVMVIAHLISLYIQTKIKCPATP